MDVLILLHLDFEDKRGKIKDLLPMDEIVTYANKNNYWIVDAYARKHVTNFDGIDAHDICNWFLPWYPEIKKSLYFENCNIILAGGYQSLCIKHVYDCISINNNVKINPKWIVSDPSYTNYDIYDLWEYPQEVIL